jgi:VanZ family protein
MWQQKSSPLKLKFLWLSIGYLMVLFVIYSSLTSSPVTMDVKFSDKILHVVGYFALMSWFMLIYHSRKIRYLLVMLFISMGIGLEFLQDLGGVRYFEVRDMLANTTGVLLAWLLVKTPFPGLLYWLENRFLKTSV